MPAKLLSKAASDAGQAKLLTNSKTRVQAAPSLGPSALQELLYASNRYALLVITALGVDAGHHVLDAAILSGGIHGLKDDEESIPVRGVE